MTRAAVSVIIGAVVGIAACAGHSGAQSSAATSASATAGSPDISSADLKRRLTEFSDDSMLGREAGTIGNIKATDYIARAAAQLGLKPAGENGTYFQTVVMLNRSIDTTSTLAVGGSRLIFGQDWLPIASRGAQSAVRPAGSVSATAVVYGGRLGDSTVSLTPAQSSGRVVVLDASLGAGGRPVATFRGSLDHYPGAVAIALATLDLMSGPALQAARRPLLVLPRTDAAPDQRPLGFIVTQAEAARLTGAPLSGLAPGTVSQVAVDLALRVTEAAPPSPARNVIAVYPGADPMLRGEYVAMGAHSDHLGVAAHGVDADSLRAWNTVRWQKTALGSGAAPTPEEMATIHINVDSLHRLRPAHRDSTFNGADDDGSGTVSLLEIAQAFVHAPAKPKRSILFVWHTAEEKGLLGSAYLHRPHHRPPRLNCRATQSRHGRAWCRERLERRWSAVPDAGGLASTVHRARRHGRKHRQDGATSRSSSTTRWTPTAIRRTCTAGAIITSTRATAFPLCSSRPGCTRTTIR